MKSNCGAATIVFDGFDQMSTKDHEQARQMAEQPPGVDVFITEKGSIHNTREEFLANGKNKEQLIKLLSVALTQGGHQVIVFEGDADTQIATEAIDLACNKKNVTVFAKDTDILILLMYFWNSKMVEITMTFQAKKNKNKKLSNVQKVVADLSPQVAKNLVFIQAWSGCDIIVWNEADLKMFIISYGEYFDLN